MGRPSESSTAPLLSSVHGGPTGSDAGGLAPLTALPPIAPPEEAAEGANASLLSTRGGRTATSSTGTPDDAWEFVETPAYPSQMNEQTLLRTPPESPRPDAAPPQSAVAPPKSDRIASRMARARAALNQRRKSASVPLPVPTANLLELDLSEPLVLSNDGATAAAGARGHTSTPDVAANNNVMAGVPRVTPPPPPPPAGATAPQASAPMPVAPEQSAPTAVADGELSPALIKQMGFEASVVDAAIAACGGDPVQALEQLLAADEQEAAAAAAAAAQPPLPSPPPPQATADGGGAAPLFFGQCGARNTAGGAFCGACGSALASAGVACPVSSGDGSGDGSGGGSGEGLELAHLVALLEGALGLSGGDLHVVDTACTMLQVPRRRGSLRDRALTCWEKLGSPALPQPGGGGASNAVGGPSVLGGVAIARPVSDGEAMYLAQSAAGGEVACGGAGASSSGGGGASSSSPSLAGPSAPWTCAVCTFLHDTPSNVSFLACEICGTPKP